MNNEIKLIASNKKAFHNYFISQQVEAGIVLEGSEVKSLRANGMSLAESSVLIKDGEMFLKNAYIKKLEKASTFVPDERRDRRLLLHKAEIAKLERKVKEKGCTLMATKVYFSKGKVKVEVGLAKGKMLHDKREAMKEKVNKMEVDTFLKQMGR